VKYWSKLKEFISAAFGTENLHRTLEIWGKMSLKLNHSSLQHVIITNIVLNGHAPSLETLALKFNQSEDKVEEALEALQGEKPFYCKNQSQLK